MNKHEILTLRKLIAEAEFIEQMTIRINEVNVLYAQNMVSIEKMNLSLNDYELMCTALWDAYEHEIRMLKEICVKHNVSKSNMYKLFM